MVHSILGKFRGVHVKIWTKLEIVLLSPGPRVDIKEGGGLLCKKSGPNRYIWISAVGLGSGGSDLKDPRSNLGHMFQIGRL